MADHEPRWTTAQRTAIASENGGLLVSASAGSGKTTVLAQRCAYLVCDAPTPCDVGELLVVTFTEAAAAEMRGRIQEALADRLASFAQPPARLARQLDLVEHAPIGTIHGFCARLLRQNFSAAQLDPQFQILDPDEAALLRSEIARDVFERRYSQNTTGQFQALIDAYGEGRDEALIDMVCHTHDLLCSLARPDQWLSRSMTRLIQASQLPLDQSDAGRELLGQVEIALERLERRCNAAIAVMKSLGSFAGYVAEISDWILVVQTWQRTLKQRGFDALVEEFGRFETGRAQVVKSDVPNKDQAKSLRDSIKKRFADGELADLLAFTESQWRAGQEAIVPHAKVFLDLVNDYGHCYAQAKSRMRGVDFSDLERKSLEILQDGANPSPVARDLHRDYRHVLVDEYQDVNEIQDAILRLVSAECVQDEGHYLPNLFTVGDVKQSIYRFRLAEPRRFLSRMERLRDSGVIHLRENFRSRPSLLDSINHVFRRLMTQEAAEIEYDQDHELREPPGAAGSAGPIEMHVLPPVRNEQAEEESEDGDAQDADRTEYEAMLCARRIREIAPPVKYGDIAILLRSMQYKAGKFADALRKQGIPVYNTGGSGFFEATEVRDMLALLNLLDNQQQDIPLAAFLRSPLAMLSDPADVMARIRLAYPQNEEQPVPFHQAVMRYAAEHDDDCAAQLRKLGEVLSRWRDVARQRPLAELIWNIYEETGYLAFVAGLEDGAQRQANLLYLHQRARQFGTFLKQGLYRFMRFVAKLREEADLNRPSLSGQPEETVRIMSIHASKGLEFGVVILPDLGKKFNLSDATGSILVDRASGLGLRVVDEARRIHYPSLSWALTNASLSRQSRAEELRLLYVAMTRAKERLILIGTQREASVEKWARDWSGHRGPLPTDEILGAGNMLDWLGPVQACCGGKVIELISHSQEELGAWKDEHLARPAFSARQRDLTDLAPADRPPARSAEAARVLARFESVYPFEPLTQLAATTSPTGLKSVDPSAEEFFVASEDGELSLPDFLSATSKSLSAADVGTATHLVLEHLDYSRPCDEADIRSQVADLLSRGLINDSQRAAVDVEAIAWLAASNLGKLLRANADGLRREVPFAAARATELRDPRDAVMLRGQIDLMVPVGGGMIVVDYKTDRVKADEVGQRAQTYQAQVWAYRDALGNIANQKVTAIYLVFLQARVVWDAVRNCRAE